MAERTKFLRNLLCKGVRFAWEPDHEKEFNDLKSAIVSPNAMLYHPDWQRPFEVHTDASKRGVGAMLVQEVAGKLRPVRFASRVFSDTESGWHTMQMELFGVKWALEQFRPYVLGKRTKVVTDHANLKWLTSVKPQQTQHHSTHRGLLYHQQTLIQSPKLMIHVPPTALHHYP